jgi:cation transport regulator ChaC
MTLHFAYGSNMSCDLMAKRCRSAQALGIGRLDNWGYFVMANGYASIVRSAGARCYGVLWRLQLKDLAVLNAYEQLDSGLYVRRYLPIRSSGSTQQALVYVGSSHEHGNPRPGYQRLVVEAARGWSLPESYLRYLSHYTRLDVFPNSLVLCRSIRR